MQLPTFPQMFYLFSSLPLEAMHDIENHLSSSVILPVPMEEKINIGKQNKSKVTGLFCDCGSGDLSEKGMFSNFIDL